MFAQTWRKHWGLAEDPFVHEDADKDPILARIDVGAVHSAFDRIYGNPATPGPGIVFGEKGSGKSGLRLALERRVERHNEARPKERVFVVEYTEFDSFLDEYRQALRLPPAPDKAVPRLLERFRAADHLDAILSVGVTRLVDEVIDGRAPARKLPHKQKLDLLALAALYYVSKRRARDEALTGLRRAMRFGGVHAGFVRGLQVLLAVVALAAFVVPQLEAFDGPSAGPAGPWYALGAVLLAGDLAWFAIGRLRRQATASRAVRAVRVLPRDPAPLTALLESVPPASARGIALPIEDDETSRYALLQRFLALLEGLGYGCVYVFMDRVDESTMLCGRDEWIRGFVERLLDHKLLQHDGVGFKLFLPIEVSSVYAGASPEEQKRMRLDKANAVQEMRWTGRELFEIADQRLQAARDGQERVALADFFAPELGLERVHETLHELGTPRHAFGFLSALFTEHARDLPEDLDPDAPEWRVGRSHFDVVRAAWIDRSRVLRRVMN